MDEGQLKPVVKMLLEEEKNLRDLAQVGKESVSFDYINKITPAIISCKTLLNEPGFQIRKSGYSEEEITLEIRSFPGLDFSQISISHPRDLIRSQR